MSAQKRIGIGLTLALIGLVLVPAWSSDTHARSTAPDVGQTSIYKAQEQSQWGGHQRGTRAPSNDNCQDAYAFDLDACSPVTFYDDNTGATEDCPALSGGVYGEVWYKFTTYEWAKPLTITYCGTVPAFYNAYIVMDTSCPCSGDFIYASSWENTSCGDGNWGYYWYGLKADGSLPVWGQNDYGQCDVPGPNSGFIAVAGGHYHSLGL